MRESAKGNLDPMARAKKKFKWGWSDSIIAVSVISLAFVGYTVYLGTVEKPAQELRDQKEACTNFNVALQAAYEEETITNFYYTLFRGAYKGIDESVEGTDLNQRFIDLAQFEAYVEDESAETMLETVGEAALAVQGTCAAILEVEFSTPTSTPAPTSTN